MIGSRLRAAIALAIAQLTHDRTRTMLSVLGVAIAVLAATLLTATGIGVVQTGQEKFDSAGRDLWITGGPVEFAPTSIGGVETPLRDSHTLANEIADAESVQVAAPLLFQTVYVSTDGSEYETIGAFGVPGSNGVRITSGRGFGRSQHFAGGSYDGPMTHEILIDQRTASLLNVSIGDTIYVGGTLRLASRNEFTIVGISPTGSQFLGTPTVSLPLSELQEITAKTGNDPATIITATTTDNASVDTVERQLQQKYPVYDIRTNQEQLRATIERQAVFIAGGVSLVILSIVVGLALTLNALISMFIQHVEAYAALKALGTSTATLTTAAIAQTFLVGLLGGAVGLGTAIPIAAGLNQVVTQIIGFENVLRLSARILILGGITALLVSLLSGIAASVYVSRIDPLATLK
jgi:ABC-type transport system, involved in lipoprotein release, permease component